MQPQASNGHLYVNSIRMKYLLLSAAVILAFGARAQSQEIQIEHFTKIIASPHINVVLEKGDTESLRLTCNGVSPEKVNVEVKGKTLHIYLDHARIIEKQERVGDRYYSSRRNIYRNATVTAYITFRELKGIDMRGETELSCESKIETSKFKLRAYGETEITLASLNTPKFKASLYGSNKVRIKDGEAGDQVYRLFGENKIDARELLSNTTTTRIYGEGQIRVRANDEFRVTAFGEPDIQLNGSGHLSRGIIIGEPSIQVTR